MHSEYIVGAPLDWGSGAFPTVVLIVSPLYDRACEGEGSGIKAELAGVMADEQHAQMIPPPDCESDSDMPLLRASAASPNHSLQCWIRYCGPWPTLGAHEF